jgi:hypothetical protein
MSPMRLALGASGACELLTLDWYYIGRTRADSSADEREKLENARRDFLSSANPGLWTTDGFTMHRLRSLLARCDDEHTVYRMDDHAVAGATVRAVESGRLIVVAEKRRHEPVISGASGGMRSERSRSSAPYGSRSGSAKDDASPLFRAPTKDLKSPTPLDTPLSNAQPFEYQQPDTSGLGEPFTLAKTPNEGTPGTWYTNPGSGQMRLYGGNGKPIVDFDFDHDHGQGIPHAHNWAIDPLTGKSRRGPGVPMSILP